VYTSHLTCRWDQKTAHVNLNTVCNEAWVYAIQIRDFGQPEIHGTAAAIRRSRLARQLRKRNISFPPSQGFPLPSAFLLSYIMADQDERELQAELARLQQEHRDLDAAIDALHQSPAPDLLRLQRLKKRKLLLRDRIAFIEDQITPDIIA